MAPLSKLTLTSYRHTHPNRDPNGQDKNLSNLDRPLFESQKGGHFSANTMCQLFLDILKNCGFKDASSHSGRRTYITRLANKGVVYKSGDKYDDLMRKVFQEKIKIAHPVSYEKHMSSSGGSTKNKNSPDYYGQPQTLASYSFFITRIDLLRVAKAIMEDYQNGTCVGNYLKQIQAKAEPWYRGPNKSPNARFWLNNYAQKYGGQFYFDLMGMKQRNIFGTEGYNGQNILIDMDKSRIVVTNSSATAWDQRTFMLEVIRDGKLPKLS